MVLGVATSGQCMHSKHCACRARATSSQAASEHNCMKAGLCDVPFNNAVLRVDVTFDNMHLQSSESTAGQHTRPALLLVPKMSSCMHPVTQAHALRLILVENILTSNLHAC